MPNPNPKIVLSDAQCELLREWYVVRGANFRRAAEAAACSEHVAYRYLREQALIRSKPRRSLRADAFRDSSPEMYYWLGYLVADGCCHSRTYGVSLIQSGERREQVAKFRAWLGSDHTISEYVNAAGNPVASVQVFSRTMREDLAALGIHPRKTYRDDRIAEHAAASPSFWLGLLDGDGWVSAYGTTRSPAINFVGTRAVLTQCGDQMERTLGVSSRVLVANRREDGSASLHVVQFQGAAAQAVLAHLYSEVPDSLVLQYKRDRARRVMQWQPVSRRKFGTAAERLIVRQYRKDPRIAPLARRHGCSDNVIASILERRGVQLIHVRRPRKRLDRSRDPEVIAHYLSADGSLPTTGHEFGISQFSVAKILKEHGIPTRPIGRPRETSRTTGS